MLARTKIGNGSMLAVWMSVAAASACAVGEPASEVGALPPVVIAYGEHAQALTAGSLLSVNGTYGAGCVDRAGESWSVLIDPGATADHPILSVVQGNATCVLTLTSVRTGTGASDLHVANPSIVLSDAYPGSATAFLPGGVSPASFYGNAKLDAVDFQAPFELSLLYSTDPRLGSASNQALLTYRLQVLADSPLSYWRLGDFGSVAVDEQGVNDGSYFNGVTLGGAGAIGSDADTAAIFDGVNDYVAVARQISDDFSIELWFNSTQGRNTGSQWYSGAGLVDAEVGGVTNDFGVTLRADGRVAAGTGNPDRTIVSTSSGFNDGNWHHVVFTRTRSTGALRLYVDGQAQGSTTGGTQSLTQPFVINFGRVQAGNNYYAGSLDEVAVYTTVLSADVVLAHYQAGVAGN